MWRIIWPATPKCNGLIKQDTLIGSILYRYIAIIVKEGDISPNRRKFRCCMIILGTLAVLYRKSDRRSLAIMHESDYSLPCALFLLTSSVLIWEVQIRKIARVSHW